MYLKVFWYRFFVYSKLRLFDFTLDFVLISCASFEKQIQLSSGLYFFILITNFRVYVLVLAYGRPL